MFDAISMAAFILSFIIVALTMKRTDIRKTLLVTPYARNFPLPPGNKPVFRWIHSLMEELNTDIACIRLANTHVIPVSSSRIAREILKKQDSIFATRPLTMGSEYCSHGYLTIAKSGGNSRDKSEELQIDAQKGTEEADNLVRYINNFCIKNGGFAVFDLRLVMRQYCGNVARKMMFGVRHFGKGGEDESGPGMEEIEHVESVFTVLTHLYAFALSDYKIVSAAMRNISKYNDPFKTEPQDFLDMFISAKDTDGKPTLSDKEIKAQITELMLATVDNPSNAVEWAMAEMINEASIMQKAVEEINMIVGKYRMVLESDLPNLNYGKACVKEAFRLHPVAPFNIPHVSTADVVVDGYFIPKGSHMLISRLGIGRNPNVWDTPLKFDPERHLYNNKNVELNEPDLNLISFSTGRRGCMGSNIGLAMTHMLLARLIQGFTCDLFMAKPLHAVGTPRLAPQVYPT
ncbi:hypothetical protein Bca52824_001561 [Brassica carinata]|uniref:Uncharacterized protein n=1 Tax=Brassica carinata TaxID=52824 RepID=A0A8X7WIS1_BRACI|nr:hypothetical protein Bca52824_001561 [Brassica carinata]